MSELTYISFTVLYCNSVFKSAKYIKCFSLLPAITKKISPIGGK